MRGRSALTSLCFSCTVLGCNWTAFDDFEKDTPVVLLNKPDSFRDGFGDTVAATSQGGVARIVVGGRPGRSPVAVYEIPEGLSVSGDALDTAGCENADPVVSRCGAANQLAGLGVASTGEDDKEHCFVLGLGVSPTRPDEEGLVGRCADSTEYTLTVPDEVRELVLPERNLNGAHQPLFLTTDGDESPALLAGSPDQALAWFYSPETRTPVLLPATENPDTGTTDRGFGSTVAVARVQPGPQGARVLALGAPLDDHVWLFRSDEPGVANPIGCLGGTDHFGRALASGDVDEDGFDDLVVSDSSNVHVISGQALDSLPPTRSRQCSLAALPEGGLIASFSCGSRVAVSGCDDSDFGAALAVGDLDGDGDGEVIVGAPQMNVREENRAGAILIYDVEGDDLHELTDILFMSSAGGDALLGSALAIAAHPERSVIVAGAPGISKAAVFFCSNLLPDDERGARCP